MDPSGIGPEFVRCHACGYSLVGVPPDSGACPECAAPLDALWRARAIDAMALVARAKNARRWRVYEVRTLVAIPAIVGATAVSIRYTLDVNGLVLATGLMVMAALVGGGTLWALAMAVGRYAVLLAPPWKRPVVRAFWWERWGTALLLWVAGFFVGIATADMTGIWDSYYGSGENALRMCFWGAVTLGGLMQVVFIARARATLGWLVGADWASVTLLGVGYAGASLIAFLEGVALVMIGVSVGS